MHTIHFVHTFSKLSETFIYDYLTSLQGQDVRVGVLTFNHVNKEERPFNPVRELKLPAWNIPRVWNIARDKLMGRKTEVAAWPVYRNRLKQLFRRQSPDVLHAHFGPMGTLLAPVADELNIPLVVTFYGYDISELLEEEYWRQAYRDLAKVAARVTVLSKDMKQRALMIGFSDEQIDVIHLGTKIDEISYREPSHPVRRFLSVGRLAEKKGHLDSLRAFNKVMEISKEPLYFRIIGEGKDRQKIRSFIESEGLSENVTLAGSLPHAQVVEAFYQADAFILHSKTASSGDKEGTPTVLAEAQAAGLPCLTTFHSGIPEMIPDKNHKLLAEEGNLSQMASNMQSLIAASEEEIHSISSAGRQHVEDAFDIRREAAKFGEIYKKLIK
ncbi:MAG: glycosyltransferase [Bacteroidetes bacterium]|jgi:glycosyltransferase involved in cell wall biosynthesis|nr:glycosyltransferase [Bacteroidota bacterium]